MQEFQILVTFFRHPIIGKQYNGLPEYSTEIEVVEELFTVNARYEKTAKNKARAMGRDKFNKGITNAREWYSFFSAT